QTTELTGSSGASDDTSDNNERALRFADILLLLAESMDMQGNAAGAVTYVNQIRSRALLAQVSAGLAQDQLMTEIRHQRMIEFAREHQRFYDLKRWGLLQQELTNSDKVGKQFYVAGRYDYFPIPQNEINTNPLIVQRSGW
ncbi:RagB/SusD family nutrient uptake outer membrane protein, partial [Pedobacter sp. L105]|uniref:RagB/SusD family nutrient uptake outer membrane protein n=1 Tax=Pedobacter sp. L105 TaxID=1641871 RepID=UPI00131C3C8F